MKEHPTPAQDAPEAMARPPHGQPPQDASAPGSEAPREDAGSPQEPPARPWPAWAWHLTAALAVAFVAVQLLVPLWSTVEHPARVRTDFSWDMFAVRRDCDQCILQVQRRGQPKQRYGWGQIYRSTYQVARSRNIDRLPLVAREVCRREAAAGRPDTAVFVDCQCRYNNEPQVYDLDVLGGASYCTPEAAARFD